MSDYEEGGMMSAYAVGGGEMEADILRNDYLSDIDMNETQSYFEEIGINDGGFLSDVFFSIREFIQFENVVAVQEGATGLRFTTVFEFFVPENTSNSTFFKVAGAQGPLTFSFDPAFEGNDDRALFELNSTTGEFRFIDPPDFERPLDRLGTSNYGVELLVTDSVSELRGFKEVVVQNLDAPPDNVFSSEIAFVNPSDVGDLILTDWTQFFVLTQDGILTWDVSGTFTPVCDGSTGTCITFSAVTWTYSTTTDLVSLTSNGSFTGLSVKGTSTNGTFSVAYTDKPLEFFVTNTEPGTFRAANRDFGDTRFITPDSDDTVTIVDSSNNSISDDVVLAASFTNNLPVDKVQTDDSGRPIILTTVLSLGLQGTDSSNGLIPGVDVLAELGRPTITGDSNTPPFLVDGEGAVGNTRVRTIPENSLAPIELNFRDFEQNSIRLKFKSQDTSQPEPFDILDGDLFTITVNPTCDSGPGSTCFLITPRVPLDFENPVSSSRQNRYSLFFEVRSLGNDQTFITNIDVQDVVNETPLIPDTSFFGGTLSNFSDRVVRIADSWDVAKTTLPPVGVYNWDYDTSSLNQNCNGSQCVGYSNIKAQYNAAFDTVTFHATGTFSNISSLGTSVSGTFDVVFDHKTLNQFAQDFPDGPGAFFFTSNGDGFGGVRVETDPDPDICDANTDSCVALTVRDTVSVKDASNNDVSNSIALALGFNFSDPPSGTGRLLIPRLGLKGADENGDFQLGDNFEDDITPNDNLNFISLGAPTTIRERAVNFANGTTTPDNISITENTQSVTVATEVNIHPLTFSFDARTTGGAPDNDLFTINATTGELTFKVPPDFENPTDTDGNNTYFARIKVSDGLDATFGTQRIQVTDVAAPNANIFTSNVQAFTASVDTVVDTWEAYFALVGDGILTWDPDLSGISQVCSGSQCLDVNRFFVSYNTNTQSATLQSTGTFTNVPVAGTDTSGTYSVTFSDRAAADLVSIQNPSTFAFSTKDLGATNVLLPDSDDVVSILSNASADVSASVTIQASTHANDPTSASFTATQVGTVSVSGTAANTSSTAAVTNTVELGQPTVGTTVVNP
jgi:hypothetical protein